MADRLAVGPLMSALGPHAHPGDLHARVRPFGDRAWLVEPDGIASTGWVLEMAGRARRRWPDITVVPGLASVLLVGSVAWSAPERVHLAGTWPDSPEAVLRGLLLGSPVDADAPGGDDGGIGEPLEHVLVTSYDGEDLAQTARALGMGVGELVARHSSLVWTVAAVGFSPGFGYLTSPDPLFAHVPRRDDPRTKVPAGAVALAAGMCAVYPSATPGGWQLIGRTDAPLWDDVAEPPALLRVGDTVRFDPA